MSAYRPAGVLTKIQHRLFEFISICHDRRAGAQADARKLSASTSRRQLLEDFKTGATVDRHASDQIITFAALAAGQSKFRIPRLSDHVRSNGWLVEELLQAKNHG